MNGSHHEQQPGLTADDIHVVDQKEMKKALRATLLGNFMEWFDIGVYAYLTASITAVFFPLPEPWDRLAFFATFAVTFLVRPLGGLILGPIGDKVGRRKVLAFTILMVALGTFLIGCIPSYSSWGMIAPILLILLKFVQGFSTGGEYAGAATFIAEYSSDRRRGYWGSFLDLGSYLGFAAAAALATVVEIFLTEDQMLAFGWRICFWVALPLGIAGIIMRSRIKESAAFEAQMEAESQGSEEESQSIVGDLKMVVRQYWRQLILGACLVMCSQVVGYAVTSFMPSYLTGTLGYDTIHGNALLIPVLIVVSAALPLFGMISDRIGRRPVILVGCGVGIVLSIPAFLLMMMGHVWSTLLGLMIMGVIMMFMVSIQASALPALFPTANRYAAMGIMFNVAVALFGGTTGGVITVLESITGSDLAGAYYIMFACVVGGVGVYLMKESSGRNLIGSMPAVDREEEIHPLIEGQHENEKLDLSTMPIDIVDGPSSEGEGVKS